MWLNASLRSTLRRTLFRRFSSLLSKLFTAWITGSVPFFIPTPTCSGLRCSTAVRWTADEANLEVRRLRTSPTAISRTPPPFLMSDRVHWGWGNESDNWSWESTCQANDICREPLKKWISGARHREPLGKLRINPSTCVTVTTMDGDPISDSCYGISASTGCKSFRDCMTIGLAAATKDDIRVFVASEHRPRAANFLHRLMLLLLILDLDKDWRVLENNRNQRLSIPRPPDDQVRRQSEVYLNSASRREMSSWCPAVLETWGAGHKTHFGKA